MLVMQDRHDQEMDQWSVGHASRGRLLPISNTTGVPVSVREDPWAAVIARVQSDLEAEVVADASEILVAEQARTTLADRLRIGVPVSITLGTGSAIRGIVADLVEGFVDVVDDEGEAHLVNLDQVDVISGVAGGLGPQTTDVVVGRWSTIVRALEGEAVHVELRSGRHLRGRIGAVGADHVDLLGEAQRFTIAITAITRLRRPHRRGAY